MSATYRLCGILVPFSCLTVSSVRAEIIVSSWNLTTFTYRNCRVTQGAFEQVVTFPFDAERTVTDGRSSATSRYDFTYDPAVNANLAIFKVEVDHAVGDQICDACSSLGWIHFSVSEELPYRLSGTYAGSGAYTGELIVTLSNQTTGEDLYLYVREGQSPGDWELVLDGELSGILLPGHEYEFFHGFSYCTTSSIRPAPASGFVEFVIPEPISLFLLSSGGLALLKRRPEDLDQSAFSH